MRQPHNDYIFLLVLIKTSWCKYIINLINNNHMDKKYLRHFVKEYAMWRNGITIHTVGNYNKVKSIQENFDKKKKK